MRSRILLLTLLSLTLVSAAIAAPPADPHHPQGAPPPSAQGAPMGMMQGMPCPMMGGRSEGMLAFLKTELKITPAQSTAWETFATAYRDVAASGGQGAMAGGMMGGGMMGGMGGDAMMRKPFPEHMAMHTQMMERHLDAAKKLHAAAQPLYNALDAGQKKTADQLLATFIMMAGM